MPDETKQEQFSCDPDLQTAREQERHSCTLHPTERSGACEAVRTARCDDGSRELHRNHFPTDR